MDKKSEHIDNARQFEHEKPFATDEEKQGGASVDSIGDQPGVPLGDEIEFSQEKPEEGQAEGAITPSSPQETVSENDSSEKPAKTQSISNSLVDRAVRWLRIDNRSLVVAMALVVAFAASVSMNIGQKMQLDAMSAKLEELADSNGELKEHNGTLKEGNKQLRDRIAELNKQGDELKAELEKYQDQQATIDDMAKKLEEMHVSYDKLLEERDGLQGQLDAKRLAEEQAAREQAAAIQSQQSSGGYGGTVYWVSGGSVYHLSPNCVALKRSNGIMSGPKSSCPRTRCCSLCG